MKHLKKLASLALALVMVMALAVPAWAATTVTNNVYVPKESANHTYDVWQILTGTPEAPGSKTFEDVEWGVNMSNATVQQSFITALHEAFKDNPKYTTEVKLNPVDRDAGAVARAISAVVGDQDNGTEAKQVRDIVNRFKTGDPVAALNGDENGTANATLPTGWYLIVDTDKNNKTGSENDSVTANLLRLNGAQSAEIRMQIKTSKIPNFKKEVQVFESVTTQNPDGTWDKMAIYPAPEAADKTVTVPFKLTADVPSSFFDKLGEGEKPAENAYQMVFHDKLDDSFTQFTADNQVNATVTLVTPGKNPITLRYTVTYGGSDNDGCTFELRIADLKAAVSAQLAPGQTLDDLLTKESKVVVQYNAQLTNGAKYDESGNRNEASLKYGVSGGTGKVIVPVFSFKLDVNKQDGTDNNKPLKGASFRLERQALVKQDDGTYKLELVTVKEFGDPTAADATDTDKNRTTFDFAGLPVGNYVLTETKAPEGGYNPIDPIYFTISATTEKGTDGVDKIATLSAEQKGKDWAEWDEETDGKKTANFTDTDATVHSTLSTDILNFKGAILPETGGIGTTIFYIVGGVLLVGAVVLLIAKRRTSADEE